MHTMGPSEEEIVESCFDIDERPNSQIQPMEEPKKFWMPPPEKRERSTSPCEIVAMVKKSPMLACCLGAVAPPPPPPPPSPRPSLVVGWKNGPSNPGFQGAIPANPAPSPVLELSTKLGVVFQRFISTVRNLERISEGFRHRCYKCNTHVRFEVPRVEAHVIMHANVPLFTCNRCCDLFTDIYGFFEHLRRKNPDPRQFGCAYFDLRDLRETAAPLLLKTLHECFRV